MNGPRQEAYAHAGLGRAHHALGDLALAREHHQQALDLFADRGIPEADEIRAYLAGVDVAGPAYS